MPFAAFHSQPFDRALRSDDCLSSGLERMRAVVVVVVGERARGCRLRLSTHTQTRHASLLTQLSTQPALFAEGGDQRTVETMNEMGVGMTPPRMRPPDP